MSQVSSYGQADGAGAVVRGGFNDILAAVKSRNSGSSAPSDPVQGMVYVKTVSSTVQELYEYDGANWVLIHLINPTTHEFRSIDGLRRTWGGSAGGTADALTITTTPAITAYENGQLFGVYTGAGANTGAMTLNVDGVGAVALKINGSDPAAGDVPANSMLLIRIRTTGGNIAHIVGGSLPRATTARYGNVLLDNEAGYLASTAGKVPTSEVIKKHARERLYAARTYYIRADGSDSNTGLVDSAGGAFLTKQKAWDTIHDTLDLNGYVVTIQIKDSTAYTDGVLCEGWCVGQDSYASIVWQGNSGTPANVRTNTTSGSCFRARYGAQFTVKDMELRTTTSGFCLSVIDRSMVVHSNLIFGACAGAHCYVEAASRLYCSGAYTINGAATHHVHALAGAVVDFDPITVTVSGTPAFSSYFVLSNQNSTVRAAGATFSGAATGVRYRAELNGTIYTNGGGASFFPGNSGGATATGGQYA